MPSSVDSRLNKLESDVCLQKHKLNELDRQALLLALKEIQDAKLIYEARNIRRAERELTPVEYAWMAVIFLIGIYVGIFIGSIGMS